MSSDPQWTVPPPPGGRPPARTRRYWAGIGLALLGHVVTIVVPVLMATSGVDAATWGLIGVVGEVAVFLACIIVGIVLMQGTNREIGAGLLIGWAVGVIVLPIIGFGVCVVALRTGNL